MNFGLNKAESFLIDFKLSDQTELKIMKLFINN